MAVLSTAAFAAAPSGAWTSSPSLPLGRINDSLVNVNGLLYLIGGYVGAQEYHSVLAYDPVAGTWTYKTPMPTARHGVQAVAISSTIYVAGGYSQIGSPNYLTVVEAYDTVADSWTTKASMPAGITDAAFATVGGKLYSFGGASAGFCGNSSYAYDPVADSWSAKTAMPTSRCGPRAAVYNGKIYVMGGQTTGSAVLSAVEVYDPVGNSWTTVAPMSPGMVNFGAEISGGTIYAVAGTTNGGVTTPYVQAYDPVANSWSLKSSVMPFPRLSLGVDVLNGRIYVVGGITGNSQVTGYEVQAYDTVADTWVVTMSVLPGPRRDAASVIVSSTLYVLGGQNADGASFDNQSFDIARGTWGYSAPMPGARISPVAAVLGGLVYQAGGLTTSTAAAANLWSYDPVADAWTVKAAMPAAGACGAAGTISGKLYVLTSCDGTAGGTKALYAYTPGANTWATLASAPNVHRYPASGVINGLLYVAGGTDGGGAASAVVDVYDPVAGTWTTKSSMPSARTGAASGVIGNQLYAAGGTVAGNPAGSIAVYDPVNDVWAAAGSSLPTPRASASGAVRGSNFYVSGGSTGTVASNAVEKFTLVPTLGSLSVSPAAAVIGAGAISQFSAQGTWTDGSSQPAAVTWSVDVSSVASVSASGLLTGLSGGTARVIASSGVVTGAALVTVSSGTAAVLTSLTVAPSSAAITVGGTQAYAATGHFSDGSSRAANGLPGAWTRGPNMPHAHLYGAATSMGGRYYVFGGQFSQTSEVYDPATSSWTALTPPPINRAQGPAVAVGSVVYVLGGCINADCSALPTAAVWAYDTATDSWTIRASLPAARQGMTADVIGGKIYAAGGYVGNYVPSAALTVYDPVADAWTTKASMPFARANGGGGAAGGKMYFAGGSSSGFGQAAAPQSDVMAYDPAADSWTIRAPLPLPVGYSGGAALNGKIYLAGGINTPTGAASTATWVYDPGTNAWSAGPPTNDPREFPAMAAGAGTLFLSDGVNGASASFESAPEGFAAAWSVDVPAVATVTAAGMATGLSTGTAHVIASSGALTGSGTVTVFTAPGLSGAALGISSVTWSWPLAAGPTGYHVLDMSGADKSGALSSSTVLWNETGLGTNVAAARRLQAVGGSGGPVLSAATTRYTLASPPAGSAAAVFVSSATLGWALNGNPAGTLAWIESATASTSAPAFVSAGTTTAITFNLGGLAACTTYYFRVRNFNGDGAATAYDSTVTARTRSEVPLPPGALTAAPQSGAAILLTWSASPSPYVTLYRLYVGTGAVNYAAPYAVLPSSVAQFLTPALSTATLYRFGLRAYGDCGGEEPNTNVVASATPLLDTTGLRAEIKVPQSGKKVNGNRVTVMAEIVAGDPARARDVRFQYRTASSTFSAWLDIPATDSQHPNPAPTAPYFVHWDVTGLAAGSYELRAIATATDATADPSPATVVIGVDSVNPDSDESLVGGSQKKAETVYNGAARTVSTADSGSGTVADVTLPSGVVAASTDTLSVQINPAGAPAAPKLDSAGQTLQITLGSGQTSLNGSASITLHYADADDDGIVDGTHLRANRLSIYSYNVAAGEWRKESASVVDKTAKTITATTPHFSLFGLFATAASDLTSVLVYPVPWVPNGPDPNAGKTFNSADPTSGIVFDGLTDAVRVQVYTVSGSLVWESMTGSSGGRIQWDGRNRSGRDVASGGYIAVITDQGSGAKVVRKIAIIR
ncbi:MAG: kelch repeat-containing protein [Elusimicrobiota bacterium]